MSPPRTSRSPPPAGPQPPRRVYAAALDAAMCPACAAHARLEYPPGHPEAPAIPNPACTHP